MALADCAYDAHWQSVNELGEQIAVIRGQARSKSGAGCRLATGESLANQNFAEEPNRTVTPTPIRRLFCQPELTLGRLVRR